MPGSGQPSPPSGQVTASLLMTFSVEASSPVRRAASSMAARAIDWQIEVHCAHVTACRRSVIGVECSRARFIRRGFRSLLPRFSEIGTGASIQEKSTKEGSFRRTRPTQAFHHFGVLRLPQLAAYRQWNGEGRFIESHQRLTGDVDANCRRPVAAAVLSSQLRAILVPSKAMT